MEFALSFGVVVPMLTGIFQFGYTLYEYNNLETAVRHAARYASLRTYDSATNTPSTAYRQAVAYMLTTGDPDRPPPGIRPGFDPGPFSNIVPPSNVQVAMTFQNGAPTHITVSVVNFELDAFFRRFRLNGNPRATFPYRGRWDPVN